MRSRGTLLALAWAPLLLVTGSAHGQGWPEIFDPLVLRTLNLQMSDEDWQTIQDDETFDIEVPTLLWLDGEEPILVSIRRKSADPLTSAPNYVKVSYKIDINELVSGQNWHDLRAVSLDNGDDQDVVSEGLAWYVHRQASLLGAPFKGGTLVPTPDVILAGLFTDGTGALVVAGTWPTGVPAGLTFWVQSWITDAAGPQGFSASNGLAGTTP